jgi:hypothetical protein
VLIYNSHCLLLLIKIYFVIGLKFTLVFLIYYQIDYVYMSVYKLWITSRGDCGIILTNSAGRSVDKPVYNLWISPERLWITCG